MVNDARGIAPIAVAAAVSVAVLIAVIGMRAGQMNRTYAYVPAAREPASPPSYLPIEDADQNGAPDWLDDLAGSGVLISTTSASTSDPLAGIGADIAGNLFGAYLGLKQEDAYSPERGTEIATNVAASIRAIPTFEPHTLEDIETTEDTSVERALRYRSDMRDALEPLITPDGPELTYFAQFIDTNDPHWLTKLTEAAARYTKARESALTVAVPVDALEYHLRVVNALGVYAETLQRLVRFSADPLATMALLRTYNEAEREMLIAFDALAQYYVRKAE